MASAGIQNGRGGVDHDAAAARTHELNFGPEHCLSLNRALTTFGPDDLAGLLGGVPRDLLAVTGGPPCQVWRVGRGKLRSLNKESDSLLKDPGTADTGSSSRI